MCDIGSRIKAVRKNLKLTLVEFSNRIGITNPALSRIENGKHNPSKPVIKCIINEFRVNSEWLHNGTGEMFSLDSNKDENISNEQQRQGNVEIINILLKLIEIEAKHDTKIKNAVLETLQKITESR